MRPTRYEAYVRGKRLNTNVALPDAKLGTPRRLWLDEAVAVLIHPGDEITIFGGYAGESKSWPLLVDAVILAIDNPMNGRICVHVGPKK